jgi:macrodomain Ter protein organizer (MatP/YcbG family)
MVLERRNNMAKQKQNTERVSVFLSPEIHQELQLEAEEKGMNVSALIRLIIMERRTKK